MKQQPIKIGIVGEFNPSFEPHITTQESLLTSADQLRLSLEINWIQTDRITPTANELKDYHGLWCSPGSPYASLNGALSAIRYARVNNVPMIGTCAGFQHMVLEYALNPCRINDAISTEYGNEDGTRIIDRLECKIAGENLQVSIKPDSLAHRLLNQKTVVERYYCSYGLGKKHVELLERNGLKISGQDKDGEPRIIELNKNDFFLASLFVPKSDHPLVTGFVRASVAFSAK